MTPRLTFDAQVFVLPSATARGFGLAPIVEARLFDGDGFSPYVALGPLYQRVWFGDAGAGGGFGGSVTVGCELRLKGGVAFQLGAGLGSRQDITATRDIRTTTQQGTFGPHWDFSVRYWF